MFSVKVCFWKEIKKHITKKEIVNFYKNLIIPEKLIKQPEDLVKDKKKLIKLHEKYKKVIYLNEYRSVDVLNFNGM